MGESLESSWPGVAVIVPTYRDQARLNTCLDCLTNQQYDGHYSITVVDNNDRFSLQALAAEYPSVAFLWEPTPGSYNARNKGIEATTEPLIAFTDSDCLPGVMWLQSGVRALGMDPAIGLVGGNISVESVSPGKVSLGEYFDMALGFPQRFYVMTHHFAATANVFTRRSVFAAVGLFDGRLKSGGDAEWGKRVCAAGFLATYEELAVVTHPARKTSEVFAKIKRTVGGARDQDPSWKACLRFVLKYSVPPARRMAKVFRFQHPGLTWPNRGLLVFYCLLVNWRCVSERLLMQMFDKPSSR